MKVCDICKGPSAYETYAHTKVNELGQNVDLCGRCYKLYKKKLDLHKFLAYQETIEEITNKPAKKTWAQRLKLRGGKNEA